MKMTNANILSARYATSEINNIFSEKQKIIYERELWLAVLKAQKELGLDISDKEIVKFEKALSKIDLDLIKKIEVKTKHDVKARIEAYVQTARAGEYIHRGMTSRDLTDNVEQMQIKKALEIIFGKLVAILKQFCDKAEEYQGIVLTARTHHQPAQPTLLGRRIAMWAEELIWHLRDLESFLENYPLRGIKGPVGTQFDMLNLLGNKEKLRLLEQKLAQKLGFKQVLQATGQVYPRSLDYKLGTCLVGISAALENFAKGMRLMAGYELVTEGFSAGQVGSSAMPHKMNTRSSERICGFCELLKMYADGASRLSGDQWEEGDVSCSVVRRVIIPDVFYVMDGLCETVLTVLKNMGTYPAMIEKELERYLPFLASTEILITAVKAGIGREEAHELIKKYAVKEALKIRDQGAENNNLIKLLAQDPVFKNKGITKEVLDKILKHKKHFMGNADHQIQEVVKQAEKLFFKKYKKFSSYKPKDIF
jgi:adenylosuccinate lyase